jgi:hypothetical protein
MAMIALVVVPAATFAQPEGGRSPIPLSQLVPRLQGQVIAAEDGLFSRSQPDAFRKTSLETVRGGTS